MLIKLLQWIFTLPLVFTMIIIVAVNVNIHYQPEIIIQEGDTIQYELLKELRGLKNALHQQADVQMQRMYPEGYVFLNAVYALAWSSFLKHQAHNQYFAEGHAEIQEAWEKINSPTGRSTFSETLSLPHGSFYTGWSSYVLASKLRLEMEFSRDLQEVEHFKHQCGEIAEAIRRTTYPESYHGAAWPADAMLCVASLSIHDKLFEPRYDKVIHQWLEEVKGHLDVRGMIPHAVEPGNGSVREDARGSSMALVLLFLHDIDLRFAQEQFQRFKNNFLDGKFGLTGIREYAKGAVVGEGDIDSGPVVMGFGGAATIVGMQTLSVFGENELSVNVRNGVEVLAFPLVDNGRKQYLFGSLPIVDAFIAWSHSRVGVEKGHSNFAVFHLYSMLFFLVITTAFWAIIQKGGQRVGKGKKYSV